MLEAGKSVGDISEHYSRYEIACNCGCGFESMHPDTLEIADWVRDQLGHSITPSSGCRCPAYNRSEGSNDTSQHPKARAMDLPVRVVDVYWLFDRLCKRYTGKYGIILYVDKERGVSFIHVDSRKIPYRKRNIK